MTDHLQNLVEMALAEDIGTGDITSEAVVAADLRAIGRIVAREPLVQAGIEVAKRVFQALDPGVIWDAKHADGTRCEAGDILATAEGSARAIFAGERTALNFLQRLSGVATLTSLFVQRVEGNGVKVLDTRKTTPGFRALERHAVRMGGGTNHRAGLYDSFLIKGNHIAAAGSLAKAISRAKDVRKPGQLIEAEVRSLDEVKEAVSEGADIIMLDNMSPDEVAVAVKAIPRRTKVEVSGEITLDNIEAYAIAGVAYISTGAITHSAPAADIHMAIKMM